MAEPIRLSAEQTAALLREIAAFVAAQVPPPLGLQGLESRRLGRIAKVATALRERIEAGVPLEQAVAEVLEGAGPHIQATLRAGLRSGQPAAVLREVADLIARQRERQLRIWAAAIYPLCLLVIGYTVLVAIFATLVADNASGFTWPVVVEEVGRWLVHFWWLPPVVFLVLGGLAIPLRRWLPWSQRWLPGGWDGVALFCDAAAMQVEAGVPTPDVVRHAAALVGEPRLIAAGERFARSCEAGATATTPSGSYLRPLIAWTLVGQRDQAACARALRRLALSYRGREQRQWHVWIRVVPAVLACVIGVTLATIYLGGVIAPLYDQLARGGIR